MPHSRTMLIIEEDLNLKRTLELIFKKGGFQVDAVSQKNDILCCLRTFHYDLVLYDMLQPESGGRQLLEQIRVLLPTTPVVVMSANLDPDDWAVLERLGADRMLVKPLDSGVILASVKSFFEQE
jgi:DNA-binding response OmpR family regulator